VRRLFASANREAARLAVTLARLAPTDLPVVLEGETGTGKTHLARAMHRRSRAGRPLVVVDCGALPETLLAAELFGHAAGAFTDAGRARRGWLERAGDGTLLLEGVASLSTEAQAVLLRVLEERRFSPLGRASALPSAPGSSLRAPSRCASSRPPAPSAPTSTIGWPGFTPVSRHCANVPRTLCRRPAPSCAATRVGGR